MSYLKLLLIRHAESLGNVQKIMEGQASTALSEMGQAQARRLGLALRASSDSPTHLYSSSLLRAKQTAAAIAYALSQKDVLAPKNSHPLAISNSLSNAPFPIQETAALQEIHPGIFQGLTWAQAEATYPDLCAHLMTTLTWQPIPQAETPLAARNRAKLWVQHILDGHKAGDVIWAVSHEGFMQHLVSVVMGCDRTWQMRIAHTAIFEFWLSYPAIDTSVASSDWPPCDRFNSAFWMLRRFNSCDHLR